MLYMNKLYVLFNIVSKHIGLFYLKNFEY